MPKIGHHPPCGETSSEQRDGTLFTFDRKLATQLSAANLVPN
ncbi:MAG: hypothetical protein R2722_01165 [Tessaracoccus sp.]